MEVSFSGVMDDSAYERRNAIKCTLDKRIIPGQESSLRKIITTLNKIKNSVISEQDPSVYLEEVQKLNFGKYLDEVSSVLACELAPKKLATILGFIQLVALFSCSYDDFMKLFREKWHKERFLVYCETLKLNPEIGDKHTLRMIIEFNLCGLPAFENDMRQVLEIFCSSSKPHQVLPLVLFVCKLFSRFDRSQYSHSKPLWNHYDAFGTKFNQIFIGMLTSSRDQVQNLYKKSRQIFETRGDLSQPQSDFFFECYKNYLENRTSYQEFCALVQIEYNSRSWEIEEPNTSREGRLIFVDKSIAIDDKAECFDSPEEIKFYTDLSPNSCSEINVCEPQQFLSTFEKLSSQTHVDHLALYFIQHSDELCSIEGFADQIIDVSKHRYDLIPAIARFFALILSKFPEICRFACKSVINQAHFLINKKSAIVAMRNRMASMIGEFCKFGLLSESDTYAILRKCCDDLDKFNLELIVQILGSCGKYLYYSASSRKRIENLIRVLKRKSSVMLPAEYATLDSVIRNILGIDPESMVSLESVESMFLSRLLSDNSKLDGKDLERVVECIGVDLIVDSLISSRSVCFIPLHNISCLLAKFPSDEYFAFIDAFVEHIFLELLSFPFVDKQVLLKSLELIVLEANTNRIETDDFRSILEHLINLEPIDSLESDWSELRSCLLKIVERSLKETAYDKLRDLISPAQGDTDKPVIKPVEEVISDKFDESLDDVIAKLSISAIDSKKTSFRPRDDAVTYLGSPIKEQSSSKTILLRAKGKKAADVRKIA